MENNQRIFSSISACSANIVRHKPKNNISNVLGIIENCANNLLLTCDAYIAEFPELLGKDKSLLIEILDDLKEYLDELYE